MRPFFGGFLDPVNRVFEKCSGNLFRSDKFKSLCTCVEGFELIRLVKGHQLNIQKRDLLHIQLRNNLDIRKNVETYFCQVLPYAVFTLISNLV